MVEWIRLTVTNSVSHEHSRSGIVLKDDLMDNPRARSPKFYPVFLGRALQKVEDFLVGGNGTLRANVKMVVLNLNENCRINECTFKSASAPVEA